MLTKKQYVKKRTKPVANTDAGRIAWDADSHWQRSEKTFKNVTFSHAKALTSDISPASAAVSSDYLLHLLVKMPILNILPVNHAVRRN